MSKNKTDEPTDNEQAEVEEKASPTKSQKARGGPRKASKAAKVAKPAPLYTSKPWKGVTTVYICAKCDHQSNDKDSMILHVVGHLPSEQRESALEKLLKE